MLLEPPRLFLSFCDMVPVEFGDDKLITSVQGKATINFEARARDKSGL